MPFTLPIWRRSICAVAGAMAGSLAGMVMGLLQSEMPPGVMSAADAWKASFALSVTGWVVILIVLGLWLHYGVSQIAWPALANSLLSATFTVFVCRALHIAFLDTILGLLIGTLIGYLLCLLCGRFSAFKGVR